MADFDRMLPQSRFARARKIGWIGFEVILGVMVSLIVFDRVSLWWKGPASYKVYVVGDFGPNGPGVARQVLRGLSDRLSKAAVALAIDGRPVQVEARDDRGDERIARQIAKSLAAADDALMVIGHFASTRTKVALPFYLQVADPPVPVILTTETNPDLLPLAELEDDEPYYPVFRLSPTDDQQAAQAADHAIEQACQTFWVVEGEQNPVYAKYLANSFVKRVQERQQRVVLWTSGSGAASIVAYSELRRRDVPIDCVFFTGDSASVRILIEQLVSIESERMPRLLLSDAAATDKLSIEARAGDPVHVIHPLSAAQYQKPDRYAIYGAEAFELLERLVEGANDTYERALQRRSILYWMRRMLNIHRVADARVAIGAAMQRAVLTQRPFELDGGRQCIFRHNGTRSDARFNIWQISRNGISDVPTRAAGARTEPPARNASLATGGSDRNGKTRMRGRRAGGAYVPVTARAGDARPAR